MGNWIFASDGSILIRDEDNEIIGCVSLDESGNFQIEDYFGLKSEMEKNKISEVEE